LRVPTAYNPGTMLHPRKVNEQRHVGMRDLLLLCVYSVEACVGYEEDPDGTWREPAWLVHGMDRDEATAFGRVWTPPTGSSWGPYQWSQLAVYENYASACGGLFASDSTSFSTVALEDAGPSWNSFTNFFGLSGATVWSAWYTGGGSQPNCDYGASFNWGSATSTLTWSD